MIHSLKKQTHPVCVQHMHAQVKETQSQDTADKARGGGKCWGGGTPAPAPPLMAVKN